MEFVVAIPSHGRHEVINNKTLKLLRYYGISNDRMYVFIEENQYPLYHNKIPKDVNLIVGKLGIKENRQFISDYFPEDQAIVSMDDDIKWICKMTPVRGGKHRNDKIECFQSLIFDIFDSLDEHNCNCAGLYPIDNPFFMKNHISCDLKFIIGNCRFFYNKKNLERRRFTLLEDFETTMKYYLHDSKIIRYNNFVAVTNYKPLKWGFSQDDKNFEVQMFNNKYPEFTKINYKANNNTDIRFLKGDRTVLSTLWIKNPLNTLNKLCFNSWIKNGYNIDLYSDLDYTDIPPEFHEYITIKDPNKICKYNNNDILAYSDYWRYNLLLKIKDAIWVDADMFLIDRIPVSDTIISSEHTMQSGYHKSDKNYVPNIGILRFNTYLGREFLEEVINKIDNKVECSKFCDNMKIFRNSLKKNKYSNLFNSVYPPNTFCPVPWWNCEEMYYAKSYKTKYEVEIPFNKTILNNCVGIHLWENFTMNKHKIDFENVVEGSLFSRLNIYYNNNIDG